MTRINYASVADSELPFLRSGTVIAFGAIAVLFAWAFFVGRNAQIAADDAEKAEIAQEDRRSCTELGFEGPEGKYIHCTRVLAEIRRKQMERWDAANP